jgi:hypothetical protein
MLTLPKNVRLRMLDEGSSLTHGRKRRYPPVPSI